MGESINDNNQSTSLALGTNKSREFVRQSQWTVHRPTPIHPLILQTTNEQIQKPQRTVIYSSSSAAKGERERKKSTCKQYNITNSLAVALFRSSYFLWLIKIYFVFCWWYSSHCVCAGLVFTVAASTATDAAIMQSFEMTTMCHLLFLRSLSLSPFLLLAVSLISERFKRKLRMENHFYLVSRLYVFLRLRFFFDIRDVSRGDSHSCYH